MIELATRAAACKHWRWMPGMKAVHPQRGRWFRLEEERKRLIGDWAEALPDLDDPATLGCLLALVREAYGRVMYVRWWDNPQPDMGGQSRARCEVVDTLGRNRLAGARMYYSSEAEALVAALEAAP